MPSNKRNSAANPGRARIALAALVALAVMAALLFGGLVALAQSDRGAVPNLRLSSAAPGELTISWDAPDPAPSDYRVNWAEQSLDFLSYKNSNEAGRGNEYPSGEKRSITLTGLSKGEAFKVIARARYTSGGRDNGPWSGPWTDTVTARVKGDPPAAPTGLTASRVAHDSVTLTWTAPSGGSAVTGYRVLRGTDANSLSAIAQDTGSAGAEYTDSTVTAKTTYFYAVAALSLDGDGARSSTVSATTPARDTAVVAPVGRGQAATDGKKPPAPPPTPATAGSVSSRGVSVILDAPSYTVVGSVGAVVIDMIGFDVFDVSAYPDGDKYTYRIDVLDSESGDVDSCEGEGMGEAARIFEDQLAWIFVPIGSVEVRVGQISSSCAAGAYTVRASVLDAEGVEVASTWTGFQIVTRLPAQVRQTDMTPTPALTSLKLQIVGQDTPLELNETFSATTTSYTANVPAGVTGYVFFTPVYEVSNPVTWSYGGPQLVNGAYAMNPHYASQGALAEDLDRGRPGWQGGLTPGHRTRIKVRVMTGPRTLPTTITSDTNRYRNPPFNWHRPGIANDILPCIIPEKVNGVPTNAVGTWSGGCRNFTGTTYKDYSITLSYQFPESRSRTNIAPDANGSCATETVPTPGAPGVFVSGLRSPAAAGGSHSLAIGVSHLLAPGASTRTYYDTVPPDNTCNNVRSAQIWSSTDKSALETALADSTGAAGKSFAHTHPNVQGWEYDLGNSYSSAHLFGYFEVDPTRAIYYAARVNFSRIQTDTAPGRILRDTERPTAAITYPGAWSSIHEFQPNSMDISGTARVGKTITVNWQRTARPPPEAHDLGGGATLVPQVHWFRTDADGERTNFLSEFACDVLTDGYPCQIYATYTLTDDDDGYRISAVLSFSSDLAGHETRFSPLTGAVLPRLMELGSTARVGRDLTIDWDWSSSTGSRHNSTPAGEQTVTWQRTDDNGDITVSKTETVPATDRQQTYRLTDADAGDRISAIVSFTDTNGRTSRRVSPASSHVVPAITKLVGREDQNANMRFTGSNTENQAIQTGAHSAGYTLDYTKIRLRSTSYAQSTSQLSLWSTRTGNDNSLNQRRPAGHIVDFLPETDLERETKFDAPPGVRLNPSTVYMIRNTSADDDGNFGSCRLTESTTLDADSEIGWNMANFIWLAARLRISWRDLDTGGGQTATIIVAGCSH